MTLGKGSGFQSSDVQETPAMVKVNNDKILASYREQAEALRLQIVDLTKELQNLNDTFNKQYADRLTALTEQEERLKIAELHVDKITREYNISVDEFQNQKDEFAKEQEQIQNDTKEAIEHNASLIRDIDAKTQRYAERAKKNEDTLAANQEILKSIENKKAELEAIELSHNTQAVLDNKISEAEKLRDMVQNDKVALEKKNLDLENKEGEVFSLIKKNKDILADIDKQYSFFQDKKEEVAAFIKTSDDKLKQIAADTERNRIEGLANKAKEKMLNEKETAIRAREETIKVLELEQSKKGEGNG